MSASRKDLIRKLLKGIETGDPESAAVVNEEKYIQHNPQTAEGGEGLAALFARLSKTNPRVKLVRVFEDGDFVFGHTEYDFSTRRIGFEVFRFEGNQAVEHWDNIQSRKGPNPSRHSMVDGPTEATNLDCTEDNRTLVRRFVQHVLVEQQRSELTTYIDANNYVEHNPEGTDGLEGLTALLQASTNTYSTIHRVLAQGNFVLVASQGRKSDKDMALYDLFRVADGKIVEHWDTVEGIAPRSEWKNNNGKF